MSTMLSEGLQRQLRVFFRRHGNVDLAYVFGSMAKGRKSRPEDLDIAVRVRRLPADPLQRLRLQVALTVALERVTRQTVDVAILNTASPVLHQQVLKYGVLVYEYRPRLHRNFQVRKLNEYFDLEPLRAFYLRRLDRRLGVR